jgi:hypothetical protein
MVTATSSSNPTTIECGSSVDCSGASSSTGLVAKGIDPEPILSNLHLREAYIAALLDVLESDFGGIEGYLESIGVTRAELATFRELFVGLLPARTAGGDPHASLSMRLVAHDQRV